MKKLMFGLLFVSFNAISADVCILSVGSANQDEQCPVEVICTNEEDNSISTVPSYRRAPIAVIKKYLEKGYVLQGNYLIKATTIIN